MNLVNCALCGAMQKFSRGAACCSCGTRLAMPGSRINVRSANEPYRYRYSCLSCGAHGLSYSKQEYCPECDRPEYMRGLYVDLVSGDNAFASIWEAK